MTIVVADTLPVHTLPGLEHRTLAGPAQGLSQLEVSQQAIAPGGATPLHRHDCEEVVVILSGRGDCELEGATRAFGPGVSLVVAPNAVHRIADTGSEPMRSNAERILLIPG